jgi:transcription initiation factor TFIIIB Brf1 subunit/transcription initiation factor TFIIB
MHCPVCKDVCEAQRKRKATENASFDHDEKRKKKNGLAQLSESSWSMNL